jgi:hypothetical protein
VALSVLAEDQRFVSSAGETSNPVDHAAPREFGPPTPATTCHDLPGLEPTLPVPKRTVLPFMNQIAAWPLVLWNKMSDWPPVVSR